MGFMNFINDVFVNFFWNIDFFIFENKVILDKFILERKNNIELYEEGCFCILVILIVWCMLMYFMFIFLFVVFLIFLIFVFDFYMKLIWLVLKIFVFFIFLFEIGKYDLFKVFVIYIFVFFLYIIWYFNFWNFNSICWGFIGVIIIFFFGIIFRGLKFYLILIWCLEV